jgi:hypothetical protein
LTDHPIETPFVGDTFQLVLPGLLEHETGASDEVLHGLRNQHLGRSREGSNPSADVDGHTG